MFKSELTRPLPIVQTYLAGVTREQHHHIFAPVAIEKIRYCKGHLFTREQKLNYLQKSIRPI
jgi:hypothetical protein